MAAAFRSYDCRNSLGCGAIRIHDFDFCGASGVDAVSALDKLALNLIVESAPDDELCVQVCRRHGIAEKDEPVRVEP